MDQSDFGNQWRNIDAPGDTDYFVRFMDVVNTQIPWFKTFKQQAVDLMEIRPGASIL